MNRLLWGLAWACLVASYCGSAERPISSAASVTHLVSGIDTQYIDDSVRAQDDFYRHVNGNWLASTEIPADKGRYGAFDKLADDADDQLRGIVEELLISVDATDPDQQKIADLYASFMDDAALEQLGLKPLDAEFAKIDALRDKTEIPSLIAHFNRIGIAAPYTPRVHQDARDSTKYVFDLGQDGLGMPDRDYYLQNDAKLKQVRAQYEKHVEKMLALTGSKSAANDAMDILALETALATVQWTKVENRDPIKTYNKVELAKLVGLAPGYNWKAYLADAGVTPTMSINAKVCETYPEVAGAARDANWEFMAHSYVQMPIQQIEDQRAVMRQSIELIAAFTGTKPTGWLGPGRGQTFDTLDYVTECGLTWFGDWILDDQPLWVKTANGPILSVPYSAEINDITLMISHHHESDVLLKRTIDAFDRLYAESAESARVMAIGVHPYVTGAAHRIKYFEQLYDYINRHDVVHWTGQQIYDWYADLVPAR